VINMSCLPEAKLAREAELAYAMICMSTDYDSWHAEGETVSVEMVMGHMAANSQNARRVVSAILDVLGGEDYRTIREGKTWEGQSRLASGMTKDIGRKYDAVDKLRWLFPGYF
jgi:5'-methylthioadenosine phosphorylase